MKTSIFNRFIMMVALLAAASFFTAPDAYAGKSYTGSVSNTAFEICGNNTCEGDVVGDKLMLIGKDGRKQVAPDGTWTAEDGEVIQVREGHILKKAIQKAPQKAAPGGY